MRRLPRAGTTAIGGGSRAEWSCRETIGKFVGSGRVAGPGGYGLPIEAFSPVA